MTVRRSSDASRHAPAGTQEWYPGELGIFATYLRYAGVIPRTARCQI